MKKAFVFILLLACLQSFSQTKKASFFYVKTYDSLPFLKFGIGEDRLGGAKMTYLDSEVILKVVDSLKTNYKVQLSQYHSAWIDKSSVTKTEAASPCQHLTDNWSVTGDSLFDYVTIQLDAKLPYTSTMEINPSRIVVDIFGATSNTNWISQLSSAQEIKNVWYEQTEDDVMKVFIELKHSQHWGYSIYYNDLKKLTIRVKRQPASLDIKNFTIAVDAGHGGSNIGATTAANTIKEKDYTLLIAKDLENELHQAKAKVIMTRVNDTTLSMYDRIMFLHQQNPDLLISIHLNDASNDSVNGVSTYYRYIGFRPLSVALLNALKETGLNEFGNIGSFNFALNGPVEYPNCLVEVAFISNKEDEKKILDPKFRLLVAQKIVKGIQAFLKNL